MNRRPSGAIAHATALAVAVELLMEMEPLQDELGRRREEAGALDGPDESRHGLLQAGDLAEPFLILVGTHAVRHLDAPAGLEVVDDALAPSSVRYLSQIFSTAR
jgi:hypothetical protein